MKNLYRYSWFDKQNTLLYSVVATNLYEAECLIAEALTISHKSALKLTSLLKRQIVQLKDPSEEMDEDETTGVSIEDTY